MFTSRKIKVKEAVLIDLCLCMGVDLDLSKLKSTVSELLWVLAWSLLFPTGNDGIEAMFWSRIMKIQKSIF